MTSSKRRRRREKRNEPLGAPPGTLTTAPDAAQPIIHVIAYGPEGVEECDIQDIEKIPEYLNRWPTTWINVEGLGDLSVMRRLGELFGLHGLALEDVLSLHHRPKIEEYKSHLFIVVRMMEAGQPIQTEQLSIFMGGHFVLTFQEGRPGDCLDAVRRRIREDVGRIRTSAPDYLVYSLLDAVLDAYFPQLDAISERIEDLETEVMTQPGRETAARIHEVRRDLIMLRRMISPFREVINYLIRETTQPVSDVTHLYLRDCYDHAVQILDLTETYREITAGLLDVYLSSVSNRMNEIVTVLTIITTVFIPLTFLAGLYGMNFSTQASPWNMPELNWYWGYPALILVMAISAMVQLIIFRRKGWIGRRTPK